MKGGGQENRHSSTRSSENVACRAELVFSFQFRCLFIWSSCQNSVPHRAPEEEGAEGWPKVCREGTPDISPGSANFFDASGARQLASGNDIWQMPLNKVYGFLLQGVPEIRRLAG